MTTAGAPPPQPGGPIPPLPVVGPDEARSAKPARWMSRPSTATLRGASRRAAETDETTGADEISETGAPPDASDEPNAAPVQAVPEAGRADVGAEAAEPKPKRRPSKAAGKTRRRGAPPPSPG